MLLPGATMTMGHPEHLLNAARRIAVTLNYPMLAGLFAKEGKAPPVRRLV
jgi:hypothetical protein